MSVAQDRDVSRRELWGLAWKAGAVSFLVLAFGGLALRAYSVLRFKDPKTLLDCEWLLGLLVFSACGAVTFATLVVGWRLMRPKRSAPGWGMGVIVLLFLLFGSLVWPTPWVYREYGCTVFQINRLTGTRLEIATLPECDAGARKDR